MEQAVSFYEQELRVVYVGQRRALTAEQVGIALEYPDPRRRVIDLFNRNRDEFEKDEDYAVCNLQTPSSPEGRGGGMQETTVFFRTGCVLLAMLSRQPRAKAFRRWAKRALANKPAHSPYPALRDAKIKGISQGLAVAAISEKLGISLGALATLCTLRRLGFTQREVALACRLSRARVQKIEKFLRGEGISFKPVRGRKREREMLELFPKVLANLPFDPASPLLEGGEV